MHPSVIAPGTREARCPIASHCRTTLRHDQRHTYTYTAAVADVEAVRLIRIRNRLPFEFKKKRKPIKNLPVETTLYVPDGSYGPGKTKIIVVASVTCIFFCTGSNRPYLDTNVLCAVQKKSLQLYSAKTSFPYTTLVR